MSEESAETDVDLNEDEDNDAGNESSGDELGGSSNDEESDSDEEEDVNLSFVEDDEFHPNVEAFVESGNRIRPEFDVNTTSTPLQILQKFLTDGIVENLAVQTNLYADQDKHWHPPSYSNWTDVDVPQLWQFFAVTYMMGIVKKGSIKEYWSTDELISTPFFLKVMSRNRFQAILRALHLTDNSSLPRPQDRFYKLGSLMKNILENFRSAINPGEMLCVDETLLAFKGRLSFRQYNPKKRARFGIKMFVLCECDLKFVLDILPYQGKTTTITDRDWIKDLGFGGAAVLTLLQDYLHKGHKVVLDNWFLGPKLAQLLLRNKTYVLGTVQRRRKGMPFIRGSLRKGTLETFCNGELLIERWSDRREVLILNTFMGHEMIMSESSNPNNTREKPATVLLYNSVMGAVDNVDKTIKPFQSVRKSFKWYKKVMFNIIDVATYNAMILYNFLHHEEKHVPYKEFVKMIVREILQKYPVERKAVGRTPSVPITHNPSIPDRMKPGFHIPIKHLDKNGRPAYSDCIYCKNFADNAPQRKTTPYSCEECKVRLCIQGENSCFRQFHMEKKLKNWKVASRKRRRDANTPQDSEDQSQNAQRFVFSQASQINVEIIQSSDSANISPASATYSLLSI